MGTSLKLEEILSGSVIFGVCHRVTTTSLSEMKKNAKDGQ